MEKRREISVRELIRMFVACSYFQEQTIIKQEDIYNYIENNYKYSEFIFTDLIKEADDTINELVNDGTLSCIIHTGAGQLVDQTNKIYRVQNSNYFIELSEADSDYQRDIINVFYDIIGSTVKEFKLTLSKTKQKK